jgi:hypothetical protein
MTGVSPWVSFTAASADCATVGVSGSRQIVSIRANCSGSASTDVPRSSAFATRRMRSHEPPNWRCLRLARFTSDASAERIASADAGLLSEPLTPR